jgi:hypothetical protein
MRHALLRPFEKEPYRIALSLLDHAVDECRAHELAVPWTMVTARVECRWHLMEHVADERDRWGADRVVGDPPAANQSTVAGYGRHADR